MDTKKVEFGFCQIASKIIILDLVWRKPSASPERAIKALRGRKVDLSLTPKQKEGKMREMWKLVSPVWVPATVTAALIFLLAAWIIYMIFRERGISRGLCALAAIGGAIVATLIGGFIFIFPMLKWGMKQAINQ